MRRSEVFSGKEHRHKGRPLDNLTAWLASNRTICHVTLPGTLCQVRLFSMPFRDRFQKKNLKSRRVWKFSATGVMPKSEVLKCASDQIYSPTAH